MEKILSLRSLAFIIIMIICGQSNAQSFRRSIDHLSLDLNNSQVVSDGGGGHYTVAQINVPLGDILITRHDAAGNVLFQHQYGQGAYNERLVSCILDANGDLVVLFNIENSTFPYPNDLFGILKVNNSGDLLNYWTHDDVNHGGDFRAVNIKQGFNNGNYFVIANEFLPGFDDAYFIEINSASGAVVKMREFRDVSTDPFALYDLAQLTADRWVLCGTHNLDFESAVLIYDNSTPIQGIISAVTFDLNTADDDNFDRVVIDHEVNRIYLGASIMKGGNEDISVLCLDFNLSAIWYREFITGGAADERINSMLVGNGEVLLAGTTNDGLRHGFISSLNSFNGNYSWSKHPANYTTGNFSETFRAILNSNQILYATSKNGNIHWGYEPHAGGSTSCFTELTYPDTTIVQNSVALQLALATPGFNLLDQLALEENEIELEFGTECSQCEINAGEFIELNNQTITQSTFFGHNNAGSKYYISGTLTVNPGATLDLTGVDLVFEENAEIRVMDGAILRANNSVFRTCLETITWNGITFEGNAEGQINDCVFKRATFALYVDGAQGDINNLKITNNQFSNCLVGVRLLGITNTGSITGNKFFVDNSELTFSEVNPVYFSGTDYTGIMLSISTGENIISQNEFVYAQSVGREKRLYGIYNFASYSDITENTFTNCYRSVDINGSRFFSVNNNEIEVTRDNINNDYQIKIANIDGPVYAEVANNRISNFNPTNDPMIQQAGIYLDYAHLVMVHDNIIHGFKAGIQLYWAMSAQIYSNTINSAGVFGIHAQDCFSTSVKCNEINMDYNSASGANCSGIRYYQEIDILQNLDIRGNCISNTYDAIVVTTPLDRQIIPVIKNNFLYNYMYDGIYNENFTGSIGTGPNSPMAGRNVFISNNSMGGALDVYSNVNLIVDGNYNIINTSPSVMVFNNNSSHSIASCGHFFANNASIRIEQEDKCDAPASFWDGMLVDRPLLNTPFLLAPYDGSLGSGPDELVFLSRSAKALMYQPEDLEKLKTHVIENSSSDVKTLFNAYVATTMSNFGESNKILLQNPITDPSLVQAAIRISLINRVATSDLFTREALVPEIQNAVKENDYFSNELRNYLNPWEKESEHVFMPFQPYTRQQGQSKYISSTMVELNVYPNPAVDNEIEVVISSGVSTDSKLFIRDILGKTILSKDIPFSTGTVTVPLNDAEPGVYLISVEAEGNVIAVQKFIKK